MRLVPLLLAVALACVNATSGRADCGDDPGDAAAVAAARAQVATDCDCAGAATHGVYVRCAAAVANQRVTGGQLRSECKGAVKRCAARSTCGRPGAVTCCRTRADGTTKCSVKRSAARCTPPRGGSACTGVLTSCCDACATGGCVTPTTSSTTSSTSTSTTTTGGPPTTAPPCGGPGGAPPPVCWGACPPETPICASGPTGCTCVAGTTPCGSATFPSCDGACGVGEACQTSLSLGCTCTPEGLPCAIAGFPTCGGGMCPGGAAEECVPVSTPDGDGCICIPAGSTCYGTYPVCDGSCPTGQSCVQYGIPGLCRCE